MKFYKENLWATTPYLLFLFFWTLITPNFKEIMYWTGLVFATVILFLYLTKELKDNKLSEDSEVKE